MLLKITAIILQAEFLIFGRTDFNNENIKKMN